MSDWDPALYQRFAGERLRPALDLLARVTLDAPARVVDLGCGSGSVTPVLRQRFPAAEITGVDRSPAMLAAARAAVPDCSFVAADIAAWRPTEPPDLIFANASLHWLDDHPALLPHLLSLCAPGGVLAVQMPAMHDAPMRQLQHAVAASGPWAKRLGAQRLVGVQRLDGVAARAILTAEAYWQLLRPHAAVLDVWETTYLHALSGDDAMAHWAAGTSLRPFLACLDAAEQAAFLRDYAVALRPHYQRQPDGHTLLPFKRLFLVAVAQAPVAGRDRVGA